MKSKKPSLRKISKHLKEFKPGEYVAIVRDGSVPSAFPKQIQGLTGTILSKRGRAYVVALKDKHKEKKYIVKPAHLKKL